MPTEQEELRLVVTLDDQASAQLAKLRGDLSSMAEGVARAGTTVGGRTRETTQHIAGLERSLGSLVTRGTFVGNVLGTMATEIGKLGLQVIGRATDFERLAREMVSLGHAAHEMGTNTAQLQSNLRAFREAGVPVEQATKNLMGFNDAMADLALVNGQVRSSLLTGGFLEIPKMFQILERSDLARTPQEQIKVWADAAKQVRQFWTDLAGPQEGARRERQFLAAIGAPDINRLRRELTEVSMWQRQLFEERNRSAAEFLEAQERASGALEDISSSAGSILTEMLGLTDASNTWANALEDVNLKLQQIDKWYRERDERDANKPPPQPPGAFGSFMERMFPWFIPPTPGGTAPGDFGSRFGDWETGPEGTRPFAPGGAPPATAPQHFSATQLNPLGVNIPEQGRSSIWELSGDLSRNIEDRRNDTQATADNTDQLRDLTGEMKRLNDFFAFVDPTEGIPLGYKAGLGGMGRLPGMGGGDAGGGRYYGGGYRDGRPYGNDTGPGTAPGAGATPAGTSAGQVPWPAPGAGNVMPPGFGGGEGPGIGGGAVSPWAGTVAPGGGGAYEGQVATPPGWGPGGAGQPWGAQGAEATATGGEAYLMQQRARLDDEMKNNPSLVNRLASIASYEQDTPEGRSAVLQSLYNRAVKDGVSLDSLTRLNDPKSFYGPIRRGLVSESSMKGGPITPAARAEVARALRENTIQFRTDQGSPGEQPPIGVVTLPGSREQYTIRPGDEGWVAAQQRAYTEAVNRGGGQAPTVAGAGEAAPYRMQGSVSIGEQTFPWASGGTRRGSLPYGTFPINIGQGDIGPVGQRLGSIATIGGPGGVINDPRYPNIPREGIQIHPGSGRTLDDLYTAGCFAVPRAQWPAFREALLKQAAAHPEGLSLQIGRGGQAVIAPRSAFAAGGQPGGAATGPRVGAVPFQGIGGLRGAGEAIDTSMLDRAASQRVDVNGTGKLEVDVKAPSGTSVKANGEGLFKKTEITRATQMEPAAHGPSPEESPGTSD